MATGFEKSDLKNVKSSAEVADETPSETWSDMTPLLSLKSGLEYKTINDQEESSAVRPKGGRTSPTPSTAETAPHERRHRFTVTPALTDPVGNPWNFPASLKANACLTGKDSDDGSQFLGSDEPASYQFQQSSRQTRNEDPPLVYPQTLWQRYVSCSKHVSDSYFMLPSLLLLTGLSIFACCMGIVYFNRCEFIQDITILMVFQGCSMIIALVARITYMVAKKCSSRNFGMLRYLTMVGIFNFLIIYTIEFFYFNLHQGYPSTEPGPLYCHPFFYNYVLWNNWATLLILVIMAAVHGPACCSLRVIIESA